MTNYSEEEWQRILHSYLEGKATDAERAAVESWFAQLDTPKDLQNADKELAEDLALIQSRLFPEAKRSVPIKRWLPYVAAVLAVFISVACYIYFMPSVSMDSLATKTQTVDTIPDLPPGGDRAILTLADGQKINLDDEKRGDIAQEQGVRIYRDKNNNLVYEIGEGHRNNASLSPNTVSTPRGGQLRLKLPDGSQVWLNAASKLTFPAAFASNERVVHLQGEAYFDVVKQPERPFKVVSKGQTIQVLGTSFNVNGYDDEPAVKTTLVEGRVKIDDRLHKNTAMLSPGQQASYNGIGFKVKDVDVADAVAWKEGLFRFNNTPLPVVLRQISRWYDVDVKFRGTPPDIKLWGEFYRNTNVSTLLQMLNYFKLNCVIERVDGQKTLVISKMAGIG